MSEGMPWQGFIVAPRRSRSGELPSPTKGVGPLSHTNDYQHEGSVIFWTLEDALKGLAETDHPSFSIFEVEVTVLRKKVAQ